MKAIFGTVMVAMAAALAAGFAPARAAAPLPIAAFYGKWVGSGIAESPESIYLGLTSRDLDVVIEPRDGGFRIAWTTVIHLGGESGAPKLRRKSSSLDFSAAGKPNLFKATAAVDPMSGQDYAWARIDYQTLTVYLLTIDAEGVYHLSSYARTLTGLGMDLVFTSIRDNQRRRTAKAKLTKQEN